MMAEIIAFHKSALYNGSTGQISLKIVFFHLYVCLYRDKTKQTVTVALWPLGLTTEN